MNEIMREFIVHAHTIKRKNVYLEDEGFDYYSYIRNPSTAPMMLADLAIYLNQIRGVIITIGEISKSVDGKQTIDITANGYQFTLNLDGDNQ